MRVGGEGISKPRKFLGYTSGKLEDFISGMRLFLESRGKVSRGFQLVLQLKECIRVLQRTRTNKMYIYPRVRVILKN